jgi:hypothetical protein
MKILLVLMFIFSFTAQAQCFVLNEQNTLVPTTETLDTCTGHWISSASDIRNAQAVEVTPEGFLQAFTFGITLYLTFWYGPFLVSLAKQIINRL